MPDMPDHTVVVEALASRYDHEDLADALERGEFRRGDSPFASVPTVTFTVRFDRDVVRRLREHADAGGVGVTQLVRRWVMERLAAGEPGGRDPRAVLTELVRDLDPVTARSLATLLTMRTERRAPARAAKASPKKSTAKKAAAKSPAKKAATKKSTAKQAAPAGRVSG